MSRNLVGVIVVAIVLCMEIGNPALAQSGIYVEFFSNGNPGDGWAAVPGFPNRLGGQAGLASGSNIFISNANSVPYRVFAVSPSSTDIGSITISAAGSNDTPTLFVGTGLTIANLALSLSTAGCRHIGSIGYGLGRPRLQLRVTGNTTSVVSADQIVRMDVAGAIQDAVRGYP